MSFFKKNTNHKKGQGLTEYGIILVLVAVAAIGVFALFGGTIKNKIAEVTEAVSGQTDKFKATQGKDATIGGEAATRAAEEVGMGKASGDSMDYKPK